MTSDLIVFGEDWGGLPSSTQHLMKHLSRDRKILWINSIGLRKPRLTVDDIKRAWKKITTAKVSDDRSVTIPSENFIVLNPKTLPAPSSFIARAIARILLKIQILPVIRNARLHKPILWTSLPTASDMIGQLNEHASVYYCGDDFAALAGVDHDTVSQREQELRLKTDLVITASKELSRRFPAPITKLLTHGVDYPLFTTAVPRAADLPDNGKPIAGFYGSLSEWLDIKLLLAVIKKLPQWDFVFIGNAVVDTSELEAQDNVYLLGSRAHQQLPSYSQHWDVSLLPFKNNAQIRACNPLKLSEYLATGKPIVSTLFPALVPYRALVSVANHADAMVEALQNSLLLSEVEALNQVLSNTVSNQSWESKAQQVNRWLDAL